MVQRRRIDSVRACRWWIGLSSGLVEVCCFSRLCTHGFRTPTLVFNAIQYSPRHCSYGHHPPTNPQLMGASVESWPLIRTISSLFKRDTVRLRPVTLSLYKHGHNVKLSSLGGLRGLRYCSWGSVTGAGQAVASLAARSEAARLIAIRYSCFMSSVGLASLMAKVVRYASLQAPQELYHMRPTACSDNAPNDSG